MIITFVILCIYVPEYFVYTSLNSLYIQTSLSFRLFFLPTMGEGAKKKRAAEAKAVKKAKKDKETQLGPPDSSTDTTTSGIPTQSKKTGTVPRAPSVPSSVRSIATRQSTRARSESSSKLSMGSADLEGTDNNKPRSKRSATVAALALLQEIQLSETEETERDPEGVLTDNDEGEDEDEDGGTGDEEGSDESRDNGSDIEVIENPKVTRKGLPKVSAAQKKRELQVIEEDSSSEDGESVY